MTPTELKALAAELTDHMVAKGVRHMKLGGSPPVQGIGSAVLGGSWHLEIELDPAAQVLAQGIPLEREAPKAKPPGECAAPGCEAKGGWLGTAYCRGHFQAELRGQRSS